MAGTITNNMHTFVSDANISHIDIANTPWSAGFSANEYIYANRVNAAIRGATLFVSAFIEATKNTSVSGTYTIGENTTFTDMKNYINDIINNITVGYARRAQIAESALGAQEAVNVTGSINGKTISSIFESNGTTVKKATNATNDGDGNSIKNTYLKSSDAASTYLTQTDASSTYLSKNSASSTYLKKTDAASTYLKQTDATSTYLTQSDAQTIYLQKGARYLHTVHVEGIIGSGSTINCEFNVLIENATSAYITSPITLHSNKNRIMSVYGEANNGSRTFKVIGITTSSSSQWNTVKVTCVTPGDSYAGQSITEFTLISGNATDIRSLLGSV